MRLVHKNQTGQPWVKPGNDGLAGQKPAKPTKKPALPPASMFCPKTA
jgi:hypothetical protein